MCDEDCVVWPSTLPHCSVSASIVTAVQIAMAQQVNQTWEHIVVDGFPYKEINWTPTHRNDRTGGERRGERE